MTSCLKYTGFFKTIFDSIKGLVLKKYHLSHHCHNDIDRDVSTTQQVFIR